MVWRAALPKRAATHAPTTSSTGQAQFHIARWFTLQTYGQSQFVCAQAQTTLGRAIEQPLSGSVYQLKPLIAVEGENRHVDLFLHGAKKRGCFERAEPLLSLCLAGHVPFDHDLAHGVIRARTSPAQRKVFLAHGG